MCVASSRTVGCHTSCVLVARQLTEEEVAQWWQVTHALDHRVHEAGVAEIDQSRLPLDTCSAWFLQLGEEGPVIILEGRAIIFSLPTGTTFGCTGRGRTLVGGTKIISYYRLHVWVRKFL